MHILDLFIPKREKYGQKRDHIINLTNSGEACMIDESYKLNVTTQDGLK